MNFDFEKMDLGEDLRLPVASLPRIVAKAVLGAACQALIENGYKTEDEPLPCCGGCTSFYSRKQWIERGEEYGLEAALVVCHDGGDLSTVMSYTTSDYVLHERFLELLKETGHWCEPITNWATAVYIE